MAKKQSATSSSPLSGMRYDRFCGDLDLDDPKRLPLDDQIVALGREFAGKTPKVRKLLRKSLTEDDLVTLMCFGERAAALALRTGESHWLFDGLLTCAMIDTPRIDPRDVSGTPGLICATCYELGIDPRNVLTEVANLAELGMSQLLLAFADRPTNSWKMSAWLHAVVQTPKGLSLIKRYTDPYHPTVPLDLAAVRIANLLRADHYAAAPTIADTPPDGWLSKVDDQASAIAPRRIIAGATIRADLRPGMVEDNSWNGIHAFVVETADEVSANTLLRLARAKQLQADDDPMMSAQVRQLFCLFVARNFIVGYTAFETNDTLQRFSPGLLQILNECVGLL